MNKFNPSRLFIARKRRKLTSKDLASKTELSPVTITRLEKEGNPEPGTVELLAKVLRFPLPFFYGDCADTLTKESASFRSLSSMSAKERDSALSAGSLSFILDDWVTSKFNLPNVDLVDFSPETSADAAAAMLRRHWGLSEKPVKHVIKLLESKGIRVFSLAENTKNVDAFSCWRDGKPYIFLNTYKTAERSRFDALHELGHLVMHRHGEAKGREVEMEANLFASHFLMPPADLVSNVPYVTSLPQLIKAKARWGVSVSALAYRLHKVGALSDWQYRHYCIQINKDFGITEPEGLPSEQSIVWEQVFRELWKEGKSRDSLARQLCIPPDELENMVFGLVGNRSTAGRDNAPKGLKLIPS